MLQNQNEFYRRIGAAGLRDITRKRWDAAIVDHVVGLLGGRRLVLDAGCGYGRISSQLGKRGYVVYGIDLAPNLIRSADEVLQQSPNQNVHYQVGDVRDLPFADHSFDAVLCLWSVFQELLTEEDQVTALREFRRVMRPGAICVVEGRAYSANTHFPKDRLSRELVSGSEYVQYMHTEETLLARCRDAGVQNFAVERRDWGAGDGLRRRLVLTIRA